MKLKSKQVTKCPKCECTAYSLDGHYMAKLKGHQDPVQRERVKCKYCGCRFTLKPIDRQNPSCVYCKGRTRKIGFDKQGRRKYKCTCCNKYFTEGIAPHRLTEHQKKMALVYLKGGYTKHFVAKLLGISDTHIRRLAKGKLCTSKI